MPKVSRNYVPRNDKVAYVKKQEQDRDHRCHWPGCKKQCPPAMWGCKEHWFKLPKSLRDKIWAAYRPGQEIDMNPSAEYLEVAWEVQAWIEKEVGVKVICRACQDTHVSSNGNPCYPCQVMGRIPGAPKPKAEPKKSIFD